jgi:protein arginine kinase activator
MKCPITGKPCNKYKAFHITNISKKDLCVFNVCEDCLSQIDKYEMISEEKGIIDLKNQNENQNECWFCKLTLEELIRTSRVGCQNCFEVFGKQLSIAFQKLQITPSTNQKELRHVGRVPEYWKRKQAKETDPNKFLLELKQKLALSIRKEEFKKSKELKDRIYSFEFLIKKIDEFKNDEEQQELIKNQIYEFIYMFRKKEELEE